MGLKQVCLILPVPSTSTLVKITGNFIDNTVYYSVPIHSDLSDSEVSYIYKWLEDRKSELWSILKSYTWMPTDAYRGHYESAERAGRWVRVAEGWIGVGCGGDEIIRKLADICELKVHVDFPIFFVFPRSSNVAVTYFDVYVEEENAEKLKRILGVRETTDKLDLDRGFWIRVS